MATNLNYQRVKSNARTIRTGPDTASTAGWNPPVNLRGWRTEWDGEPFPVTVTSVYGIKAADAENTAA